MVVASGDITDAPRDGRRVLAPTRPRPPRGRVGMVLSLAARGLSVGEVSAAVVDARGESLDEGAVAAIIDDAFRDMSEWCDRPLDPVYPVIFVDTVIVEISDGRLEYRSVCVATGVTIDGQRDTLGLWPGDGGEDPAVWTRCLRGLQARGVDDCCVLVGDVPDTATATVGGLWPRCRVETRVLRLIRDTLDHPARRADRETLTRHIRAMCTAPTPAIAATRLDELDQACSDTHPQIGRSWRTSWPRLHHFLDYAPQIRGVLCAPTAITLPASYQGTVHAREPFPDMRSALRALYLTARSHDAPPGGRAPWIPHWKPALNALAITFEDRLTHH